MDTLLSPYSEVLPANAEALAPTAAWKTQAGLPQPIAARRERPSPTFFFLSLYLILFFLRPHDYVPALAGLHLPFLVAGLCAAGHLFESLGSGRPMIVFSPITKTLALLTAWMIVGLPFAYWRGGAFETLTNQWLKMLVLFVLLSAVVTSLERLRRVLWVCTLCVAAVGLNAMAGYGSAGATVEGMRLAGGLGGPYSGANYLSMTILIFLPFVLFSFCFDPSRSTRWLAGAATLILVATNVLTHSRAGALAFLIILIMVSWKWRQLGRSPVTLVTVTLLGLTLFLALAPESYWQRLSTLVRDPTPEEVANSPALLSAVSSEEERSQLLKKGVALTLEHPILGVGVGNFIPASAEHWNTGSGKDWLTAHNTYLQVSAELGLPGLALYLILLALIFRSLCRTRRLLLARGSFPLRSLLHREALTCMLVVFIFTCAFASLAYDVNLFLIAGLTEAFQRQPLENGKQLGPPGRESQP